MAQKISAATVGTLPTIAAVMRSWQAAAMLNAVLEPDRRSRVFEFVLNWRSGVSYGNGDMRQGICMCGAFTRKGAIIRGYNESSPLASYPAVRIDKEVFSRGSRVPPYLRTFLKDKAFDCGGATFCIWRTPRARRWATLKVMHSSEEIERAPLELVELLVEDASNFVEWASWAFERKDLAGIIRRLYAHEPLAQRWVGPFSQRPYAEVCESAAEIGYPIAD